MAKAPLLPTEPVPSSILYEPPLPAPQVVETLSGAGWADNFAEQLRKAYLPPDEGRFGG